MCIDCMTHKIILKKHFPTEIIFTFNMFGRGLKDRNNVWCFDQTRFQYEPFK